MNQEKCQHNQSHLFQWFPCHRRADRSFFIYGKQMPICARCTAILIGYLFTPFAIAFQVTAPFYIIILICIPMLIDGFTQLWKWRESSNILRFITGLAFGIGQSLFISTVVIFIVEFVK
ncbi:DUF2085 domain-containing protein [Bacillus sp. JJ722]|uniref:DUF2085 domain-containing protein n=1 Tax=Bacillus sp. JJ722 TaxID=3122973 RepID=UPI002FFE5C4B